MTFFEKIFRPRKKAKPEIDKVPEAKASEAEVKVEVSEIKEEGGKIYFEVSQDISIEKVEQIFNEITGNLDITPMIRQGFGIEADSDKKVSRVIINTENFSHIAGFKDYAKQILESLHKRLKEGL